MKTDFTGKKILVTGGTRGIGAAIALAFAKSGGQVTVTATSKDSFEALVKQTEVKNLNFETVDFASLEQTQAFSKKISQGAYDILINNAGINKVDFLEDVQLQDWQTIQDVNLRAPMLLAQSLAPSMKAKKWGRIINISSVFGVITKEKRTSYSASKFGLVGMTKTMAVELAAYNVLVNAVSPGFIDTELTRKTLGEQGIKEMLTKVPLARLGRPEDIANLVLFLSSDLNNFITGENVVIDGGFTCA